MGVVDQVQVAVQVAAHPGVGGFLGARDELVQVLVSCAIHSSIVVLPRAAGAHGGAARAHPSVDHDFTTRSATKQRSAGMEYRQLGRSGLKVSTVTLGTMGFGGTGWASPVGHLGVKAARQQIDICLEAGVNLIDTADIYSERPVREDPGRGAGRRPRGRPARHQGARRDGRRAPTTTGLSRHHIMRGVEASLRRLGTDYIDLYQVHEWDGLTPQEETLSALDALVQSGQGPLHRLRRTTPARQLMKALWISDLRGWESYVSQQIYYSLQARDAENELIPIAIDEGLGVLVWSPLAGGLLSGKYRRGQDAPEGTRRFEGWTEPPVDDEDRLYDTVDVLVEIGEGHGVSAAQVALAYTLAKPAVTSVIVGARTEEQLRDNLAAAELTLTADELDRLDTVEWGAAALPLLAPGERPARPVQPGRPQPHPATPGLTPEVSARRLWSAGPRYAEAPCWRVRPAAAARDRCSPEAGARWPRAAWPRRVAHADEVLPNGGQGRDEVGRLGDVVETDHTQVRRHPPPGVMQCAEQPDRHLVVGAEHGGRPGVEDRAAGGIAARRGPVAAQRLERPLAGRGHLRPPPVPARPRLAPVVRTGEVHDLAMSRDRAGAAPRPGLPPPGRRRRSTAPGSGRPPRARRVRPPCAAGPPRPRRPDRQ